MQHTASRFEMDKEMYSNLDRVRAQCGTQQSDWTAAMSDVHALVENGERRIDAARLEIAELRDGHVRLGLVETGCKRLEELQRVHGEAERTLEQRLCTLEHGVHGVNRAHAQLRLAALGQAHGNFGEHNSLADLLSAVQRTCDEARDELRSLQARPPLPPPVAQPTSSAESALEARVSQLSEELRAQRVDVEKSVAHLAQLIDANSRAIGPQLDERMHAMEQDVTKLRRLRKLIESQVDEVGSSRSEMGSSLSEMQRKIDAIEQDQSRRFIQ